MGVERFVRRARRESSVDRANLLKYDNSKIERLLQPTKDEGGTSFRNFVDINRRRSTRKSVNQNLCNNESESGCTRVCTYVCVARGREIVRGRRARGW